MNKIASPQPVIRKRRVVCLFMSSTSSSDSDQKYEPCEMLRLSTAFRLPVVRVEECLYMTRRAVGGSGKRH